MSLSERINVLLGVYTLRNPRPPQKVSSDSWVTPVVDDGRTRQVSPFAHGLHRLLLFVCRVYTGCVNLSGGGESWSWFPRSVGKEGRVPFVDFGLRSRSQGSRDRRGTAEVTRVVPQETRTPSSTLEWPSDPGSDGESYIDLPCTTYASESLDRTGPCRTLFEICCLNVWSTRPP